MTKYIGIAHEWFVSGSKFTVFEIEAVNRYRANQEAKCMAYNLSGTCNHADAIAIPIGENELIKPRQLTWKERFTGEIVREE